MPPLTEKQLLGIHEQSTLSIFNQQINVSITESALSSHNFHYSLNLNVDL